MIIWFLGVHTHYFQAKYVFLLVSFTGRALAYLGQTSFIYVNGYIQMYLCRCFVAIGQKKIFFGPFGYFYLLPIYALLILCCKMKWTGSRDNLDLSWLIFVQAKSYGEAFYICRLLWRYINCTSSCYEPFLRYRYHDILPYRLIIYFANSFELVWTLASV